jgi:hypothetical protein
MGAGWSDRLDEVSMLPKASIVGSSAWSLYCSACLNPGNFSPVDHQVGKPFELPAKGFPGARRHENAVQICW